jgi:hypothetical protein
MQPQPLPQPHPHERSELPATARGRLKLTDWVIGTVPDLETARECAHVLADDGFADDDLLVEPAMSALQQLEVDEQSERDQSRLARLVNAVEDAFTGRVPTLRADYREEARAGRSFIGARDAQGNQIDRIRNVLVEHGARTIYLFEPEEVRRLG